MKHPFTILRHPWLALAATVLIGLGTFTPARAQEENEGGNPTAELQALKFRNIGPAVAGGRVTAVYGEPGNPDVMYVGAAGGGIFKTTDGGGSWKPIFEDQPTASIGDIALAPSNPNLVWVGTGEANLRTDIQTGKGVFFSPDGGKNWKARGLEDVGQIGKIAVDPNNPKRVYVAAIGHAWGPNKERGLYRTEDGGKTWKKVLYISDKTGVVDVEIQPGNPQMLFAAAWQVVRKPWNLINGGPESAIYKSMDGGDTWQKLDKGLPEGDIGRIELATSRSKPDHVYALIESKNGMLWDTHDAGAHWKKVNDSHRLSVRPFYFSTMAVDPANDQHVYFCSFFISESFDGGKSTKVISRDIHPDHHDIWVDPQNPRRIMDASDGGLYVSSTGGDVWHFHDQLPVQQFYQVAVDSLKPYHISGGLQDNSAWYGPSHNLHGGSIDGSNWFTLVGGDGEYAVPAPSDPNTVYAESQNGYLQRINLANGTSKYIRPYALGVSDMEPSKLKYRFNWTTPVAVSAHDANTVYMGANVLFKTTDGGDHWNVISPDLTRNEKDKQVNSGGPIQYDISGAETYNTILSIGLSPHNSDVIWTGSDDGLVHVTRDGGKNWDNVTGNIPDLPDHGRIYQLDVSAFDPGTCYIAVDYHMLDNNKPYVYRTHDYGRHWKRITDGLPGDDPVHVVREDPNTQGFLVAGTGTGLYYSHDDGDHWREMENDFPTASVWDLKFQKTYHDLVVSTHGRGIFVLDNIRPLEGLTDEVKKQNFHLFSIRPAYMYHTNRRNGLNGPNNYSAPNPPSGAIIDYYLKDQVKTDKAMKKAGKKPVQVVISSQQGDTVNTLYASAEKGINRFTWNLRYPGPARLELDESNSKPDANDTRGPRVLPGRYKVSVSVDGRTQSHWLNVKADPRDNIPFDRQAAQKQQEAAFEVRGMVTAVNQILNRIDGLQQQLKNIREAAQTGLAEDVNAEEAYPDVWQQAGQLDSTLTALKDRLYNSDAQDVVQDNIHYLSRFRDRVRGLMYTTFYSYNEAPGPVFKEEKQEVRNQLNQYVEQANHLFSTEVKAFNTKASGQNLPTLVAGSPISMD